MLEVKNLSKRLDTFAMRDVSFNIGQGEYFVLLGVSGVGKTVLLEIIAGVMRPDRGTIALDGRDITFRKAQNRSIGLVYQDQALFPHLSVRQNIAYGLRCRKASRSEVREKVTNFAERVGAQDILDRNVESLSGGEAQRVALARTMVTEPRCLLLDEPIASLDAQSRGEVRSLLRDLNRRGQTILHVTHDYEEAVSLASRIAIMEGGTIAQTGSPEDIFHHPNSEFVANFVGIKNFFRGTLEPPAPGGQLSRFADPSGLRLWVLTDQAPGTGCLLFRSQDLAIANERPQTSAKNIFEGQIIDIIPAKLGVEVTVQIGVKVSALLTRSSINSLRLEIGKTVWVHFKASAGRFLRV